MVLPMPRYLHPQQKHWLRGLWGTVHGRPGFPGGGQHPRASLPSDTVVGAEGKGRVEGQHPQGQRPSHTHPDIYGAEE